MKQITITGEIEYDEAIQKTKKEPYRKYVDMQKKYGKLEGKKCGDCKYFLRMEYYSFFKCELKGVSHSTATDIRKKDIACGMYEVNDEI